jgi:octaprenyl-diphosphate synthase
MIDRQFGRQVPTTYGESDLSESSSSDSCCKEPCGEDAVLSKDKGMGSKSAEAAEGAAAISSTSMLSASVRALIGTQLAQVEEMLATELRSVYPVVNDLASKAASLGGKRLRPILTLLSALAVGKCSQDSVRVATTVELVHAASLVHDDVMDNAAFRRHQATIHAQVGVHRSIMLGDYLFTRAYSVAADCRSRFPARCVATAATQLCEGELRQQASTGNWSMSEAEYFDILRQKTGELCAVSCRLGAWSAAGSSAEARALSQFGRRLGVAFQVIDDWLDVWGTPEVGKTLGTDLTQRKPTLPTIRLFALQSGRFQARLLALLDASPVRLTEVQELLASSDAAEYTYAWARRLIDRAIADLRFLPESPSRDCLALIARQCIERVA